MIVRLVFNKSVRYIPFLVFKKCMRKLINLRAGLLLSPFASGQIKCWRQLINQSTRVLRGIAVFKRRSNFTILGHLSERFTERGINIIVSFVIQHLLQISGRVFCLLCVVERRMAMFESQTQFYPPLLVFPSFLSYIYQAYQSPDNGVKGQVKLKTT